MVLVSIQPFAFRKTVLLVATLLFSLAICFSDSIFLSLRPGPAGRELTRFKNELSQPQQLSPLNPARGT